EWADRYAYLSPENSAEPGKWQTLGYQKGMMNAVTDPRNEKVTFKKSARVGYTKIIDHAIGFYADQEPSPMMVVQPTLDDAKGYSTDEVIPMVRDTPVLKAIEVSEKEKGSGVTQLKRKFTNGASLILVGANSARGFRRVTIRALFFDEVDGYPVEGAGAEGDQIKLGIKRTETFWNRRIILGSTPTVKGASKIDKNFQLSDKRYFAPPCPHCKERNIWKFSPSKDYGEPIECPDGIKIAYMKWPKGKPEEAHFICGHCGCEMHEEDKAWMIDHGRAMEDDGWVATAPFKGHAGLHIWAAYSLFPNAAWSKLAAEFLESKSDPQALQVFVNTVLGEVWEDRGERVDGEGLIKRRENYGLVCPRDVVTITAGVDIQGNRIEVERVGWGLNGESWGLEKTVLYGDPTGPLIWDELDELLATRIQHEGGFELPIAATCVDANYLTQTVTQYCSQRFGRRIWAIRGIGGAGKPIWPKKASKTKGKLTVFNVGTDAAKELVYSRLRMPDFGPGYSHFNMSYDEDHFKQLTSEEVKIKYFKGQQVRYWDLKEGHKRNEALDIRVYATAALEALKVGGFNLKRRKKEINARTDKNGPVVDVVRQEEEHEPVMVPVAKKKKRSRRRVRRSR
ncbi:phage terminase large subunit family protein, partial [uncultured Kiloniella sp.]|uniref:phage terminase large subunit family protein n=1 Tax=uncultured Kiloniella sp. TaxID=1133091 RepID=UPI00262822DC